MSFERNTTKKVYYYVICAITLFILMWGFVDMTSAVLSVTIFKPSAGMEAPSGPQAVSDAKAGGGDQPFFDEYYQGRMAMDRIGDSMARVLVAGIIFIYSSLKIKDLEGKEI
jgi:hypothetical protein